MDKKEFTKLMIATAKLYDKELDQETLEIWLSFFIDCDFNIFKEAMKEHINVSNYFPKVAEIKNIIYNNTHNIEDNSKLWDSLAKAISRSSYYSEEEFDKLPEVVKLYVRSPEQLREMAIMDSDIVHSVVKGQFMKQIENIKEQVKNGEIVGRKDNLLMNKGIYQLEEVIE